MNRYIVTFIGFLLCMLPGLQALQRDSSPYLDEKGRIPWHFLSCQLHANYLGCDEFFDWKHICFIPETGPPCYSPYCKRRSIFWGYLSEWRYLDHFINQVDYCYNNKKCTCYWPECSPAAAQISDLAYSLFDDLLSTSPLSSMIKRTRSKKEGANCRLYFEIGEIKSKHYLVVYFIGPQFRFSDYYYVCRDIEEYLESTNDYNAEDSSEICDRLSGILEALYPKFFALYSSCYEKHPNEETAKEIQFMKLLCNGDNNCDKNCLPQLSKFKKLHEIKSLVKRPCSIIYPNKLKNRNFFDEELPRFDSEKKSSLLEIGAVFSESKMKCSSKEKTDSSVYLGIDKGVEQKIYKQRIIQNKEFHTEEFFLEQGIMLNNFLLHKEAVPVLTLAITSGEDFDVNRRASRAVYLERAFAYFETNQIDLALKDYEKAKKAKRTLVVGFSRNDPKGTKFSNIYIPKDTIGFSRGLISGILKGAKASAVEFVPSTFNSCRGLIHGLWAFACSPSDVTEEVICTAYSIGTFISTHKRMECLECLVPEIRELSILWDTLDDNSKGKQIGYIIGKYGIDIFIPIAGVKAVNKIRALKRANTMATLESCASSEEARAIILQESSKRAELRKKLVAATVKKGKIAVKSSNTKFHIMQEKHAWEKVVELSGDVEKDFDKVVLLLEENNILSSEYLLRSRKFHDGKVVRADYKKLIHGYEIEATFETYVEVGETFLKDGWVKTRQ